MGGQVGYIDATGKYVINPQFDVALPYFNGILSADKAGMLGYRTIESFVDENEEWVIVK
jgi:hypothetical protein